MNFLQFSLLCFLISYMGVAEGILFVDEKTHAIYPSLQQFFEEMGYGQVTNPIFKRAKKRFMLTSKLLSPK